MGELGQQGNPFAPEPGQAPGHLAGRDEGRQKLDLAMARIARPRPKGEKFLELSPCPPIKIVGARGTGKTALLGEARRLAATHGVHAVSAVRLDELNPDGQLYADLLAGLEKGPKRDVRKLLRGANASAMDPLDSREQMQLFMQVLHACLEKQPLALLVDEAMDCDPDALGSLLLLCKQMIGCKYPLALLLAGTPRLERTLAKARAGFMDLAWRIDIGLLAPPATAEALRRPFEDRGVKVQAAALERMENLADGHPLFTQVVGFEVWNALAAAGCGEVDEKALRQAEQKIKHRLDSLHRRRYGMMLRDGLIRHGRLVMEVLAMNGGRAMSRTIIQSLENCFADDDGFEAVDVYDELEDRGFIWSRDRQMEAGIPSFFRFCEAEAKKAGIQWKRPGDSGAAAS